MRYRDYKTFSPGQYYHIFNRGNNKKSIFIDDSDYFHFIKRAKLTLGLQPSAQGPSLSKRNSIRFQPVPKNSFDIIAYCLMPNHYHFLIKQNDETTIDRFISKLCTSYSAYFRKKYAHFGHIFQDKFKAKPVENDTYLMYLSAYIHNNPKNPLNYKHSSILDYAGLREDNLTNKDFLLSLFSNNKTQYINFVTNFNEEDAKKVHDESFS